MLLPHAFLVFSSSSWQRDESRERFKGGFKVHVGPSPLKKRLPCAKVPLFVMHFLAKKAGCTFREAKSEFYGNWQKTFNCANLMEKSRLLAQVFFFAFYRFAIDREQKSFPLPNNKTYMMALKNASKSIGLNLKLQLKSLPTEASMLSTARDDMVEEMDKIFATIQDEEFDDKSFFTIKS